MEMEERDAYSNCMLCPRKCGADRRRSVGFCGMGDRMYIARAALHMWEEPCISGEEGSGTVFFSGCNMGCIFCQNRKISRVSGTHQWAGVPCDAGKLADVMLHLQEQRANNINLVTPTHFVPSIVEAVRQARRAGLTIPIVYNSGGYENVETLKRLEGTVDIYLPDMKYLDNERAGKYSNAPDYAEHVKAALDEMYRQVGRARYDGRGIMVQGMIVRHLVLPGGFLDSIRVIDYLYERFRDQVTLSLMSQYTPMEEVLPYPELRKRVSKRVYDHLIRHVLELQMENVLIQSGNAAEQSFIPEFNGEGFLQLK